MVIIQLNRTLHDQINHTDNTRLISMTFINNLIEQEYGSRMNLIYNPILILKEYTFCLKEQLTH